MALTIKISLKSNVYRIMRDHIVNQWVVTQKRCVGAKGQNNADNKMHLTV